MVDWMIIPNFPKYEISEYGDVVNRRTGKRLRPSVDREGYIQVCLYSAPKSMHTKKVHRLVYETFTGEDITGLEINHLDCDVSNNHLSNLEACDRSRNMQHAFNMNRRHDNLPISCVETNETYISMSEAARALNLTVGHVHMQVRGIVPHAKGYHFELVSREEAYNGRGVTHGRNVRRTA